jgi:hypothetical protein
MAAGFGLAIEPAVIATTEYTSGQMPDWTLIVACVIDIAYAHQIPLISMLRGTYKYGIFAERIRAKVPHGRTFLAALRQDRITAPWLLEDRSMVRPSNSTPRRFWFRPYGKATSSSWTTSVRTRPTPCDAPSAQPISCGVLAGPQRRYDIREILSLFRLDRRFADVAAAQPIEVPTQVRSRLMDTKAGKTWLSRRQDSTCDLLPSQVERPKKA